MASQSTRRNFLKNSTLASAGFWVAARPGMGASKSPNEKLNVAGIGVGGKGTSDIGDCASENIVALCDVDYRQGEHSRKQFPKAKWFYDFREMLDKMHKEIDAVTVSTPDHMHAPAAIMAMKMGKHVYCQKPLVKDVYEARMMLKVAKETGVATQMGNQGTSESGLREAVEVIQSGAIGDIVDVHVWTNRPVWPQGTNAILGISGVQGALRSTGGKVRPDVPKELKWDLWLGTAPERTYYPNYHPFAWRGWWDYGTGAIGDMAMHTANMAWMACKLRYPDWVEAECSEYNPETFPMWSVIRFGFPAPAAGKPKIGLTWYDGGKDKPAWVNKKLKELAYGNDIPGSGSLIIGTKGTLFSPNDYGAAYKLLPEADFEGYKPPTPSIPRSPGHTREWLNACKGGPAAMSNFSYAAPFTEAFLLGCLAMRTGKRLEWDGPNMRITNDADANKFLKREYRKGWEL